jgi:transcriptional regulator with XRE-family HTH domain
MEKRPLGKLIRKLRKAKGFTAKDLADAAGVSPSAISRWENDGRVPRGDHLFRLELALCLEPGYLAKRCF